MPTKQTQEEKNITAPSYDTMLNQFRAPPLTAHSVTENVNNNNNAPPVPLDEFSKYGDDSSDEDEANENNLNYDIAAQWYSYITKYPHNATLNDQLSFAAHAIGRLWLYGKNVNDAYYAKKKEYLSKVALVTPEHELRDKIKNILPPVIQKTFSTYIPAILASLWTKKINSDEQIAVLIDACVDSLMKYPRLLLRKRNKSQFTAKERKTLDAIVLPILTKIIDVLQIHIDDDIRLSNSSFILIAHDPAFSNMSLNVERVKKIILSNLEFFYSGHLSRNDLENTELGEIQNSNPTAFEKYLPLDKENILLQLSINIQRTFYNELCSKLGSDKLAVRVRREQLKKTEMFATSYTDFYSNFRLSNRSAIIGMNEKNGLLRKEVSSMSWGFSQNGPRAAETYELTKHSARNNHMPVFGNYKKIMSQIQYFANFTRLEQFDASLVYIIRDLLWGREEEVVTALKNNNGLDEDIIKHLLQFTVEFTYLLFNTEVARNPSAVVTNALITGFILDNPQEWNWKKVLNHPDFVPKERFGGGWLPMSMADADVTQCARRLNDNYNPYMPHYYRYPGKSKENSDAAVKQLKEREAFVICKWSQHYSKDLKIPDGRTELLTDEELISLVDEIDDFLKQWYIRPQSPVTLSTEAASSTISTNQVQMLVKGIERLRVDLYYKEAEDNIAETKENVSNFTG